MVEVLKKERVVRGWTQEDVAYKLGITNQGQVSQWETGKVLPGLNSLRTWAALFDMAPELRHRKPVRKGRIH